MLNKGLITSVLLLFFIGIGCGTSGSLASEDKTDVIGVVIDQDTNDRVADAEIQFAGVDEAVVTSENGTFTVKGVDVGTQTITISAPGHEASEQEVEIVNDGTRLQLYI